MSAPGAGSDELYVAVAETHTGALLFLGDLAYKVKKPVSLGFVDWTDRAERGRALDAELALNRRLAPDVYLGTATLPRPGGEAEPVLVMRRLPADRRLSELVARGDDVEPVLRQIAHRLAAFHLAAPVTDTAMAAATVTETRRRWEANHTLLRAGFGRWIDGDAAEAALVRACRYLEGRATLFAERVAGGWARDGHGDLLADDIFCLDDGPRILDCLDFDEHLRVGDVLADVAFLAMDLERLGRADLAWGFLERHRELTADAWPASLAHHYVAYRAHVRTLVSCLRGDQGDETAGARAAGLLSLAERHLAAGRVRLVLVGGAPATGKSTLAAALGDHLGVAVLRSDEIRKELAGLPARAGAAAHIGEGIYTPEWTERTYTALLDRAHALLRRGETVILDATWGEAGHRDAARTLAGRDVADLIALRCVLPASVARARAEERARAGCDASDAGGEVAAALAATFEPWPDAIPVSTETTPDAALRVAVSVLA